MAHSKTKAGGGGSNARQVVNAPSAEDLDALISRLKGPELDISKYVSIPDLANKLRANKTSIMYYAQSRGYSVVKIKRADSHGQHTGHLTLEDAARLVEQRAKEGLL